MRQPVKLEAPVAIGGSNPSLRMADTPEAPMAEHQPPKLGMTGSIPVRRVRAGSEEMEPQMHADERG